ncbi:MAG: hypothetical protein KatS3mg035_0356 [Bacteroidia bacterium]|nr:MAG: hypothetical protein KatS3mg035_0356 [Bacteroidia bacterium]
MKKIFYHIVFFSIILANFLNAQVGIGTLNPHPKAALDIETIDRGLLLPRLTTAQRDAMGTVPYGLVIFNTTDSIMQYFNGECWLNAYQQNCTDCYFNANLTIVQDTIDRLVSDSIQTVINVNQIAGTPQNITLSLFGTPPVGVTHQFSNNPIMGSGSSTLTFYVTPFTPAGTFPILIQAFCGPSIRTLVYVLTILPCYELTVLNNTNNYSVSTHLYQQYPNAPTNSPVCVVTTVNPGVLVSSPNAAQPAFTTGNLPAGSIVGIINNGAIIGKGGDGGIAYDPINNLTGNGTDGGHALYLTTKTAILNNGYLFGGGGGGGSAAFRLGFNLPLPSPLPNVFIGFAVGSGGGGGAGNGQGGVAGSLISLYANGQNGTGGIAGTYGMGGILNNPFTVPGFPISIGIGTITLVANPNTVGGAGGPYGLPGSQGVFNISLTGSFSPIIGPTISLGPFTVPIPVPMPLPGAAGFAVKRNGNLLNGIPDNNYQTIFIKGQVGN